MRKEIFQLVLIAFVMWMARPVQGEDTPEPTTCINEIRQVCNGLDAVLEKCLAERAGQLSDPCRDLLKTSIAFAENNTGPGACLGDIQQFCSGLQGDLLTQCVVEKKTNFSQTCRDYLDAASSKGSSNTP